MTPTARPTPSKPTPRRPPTWPAAIGGLLVAALLGACGGGGSDGNGPAPSAGGVGGAGVGAGAGSGAAAAAAVPAPVARPVAAAGGQFEVELADGARATLEFAPASYAADTTVTVTPAAPQAGEWTRLIVSPAPTAANGRVTLRVRPPAAVAPAQVPVLQLMTADGPVPLRTRRQASGELHAEVPAALTRLESGPRAAAAPGRMQALATSRRLADGERGGEATVVGTGFLATCEAGPAVLADAMRVIQNASSAGAVHTALATLGLVADRCVQPGVLDEAGLLRVNQALQDLARRLPAIYASELATWQARNYLVIETETEPFKRGVRRLLALCAAAGELGATLVCPLTPDYEPEYVELGNGFNAAAGERQHSGGLRLLLDQLLPLPAEAALFGLPAAEAALRNALATIADQLMDRAYTQCSHGELFEWRVYVEQGGFSRRGFETLQRAMAYCGIGAGAAAVRMAADGSEQRGAAREYAPGALDGSGRILARTVTVTHDGLVAIAAGGESTRCSRVIGAGQRSEAVSVRAGAVRLGQIELNSENARDRRDRREVQFSIRHILETLGRRADSMDPIELTVWRDQVGPLRCADARGNDMIVEADELKLYTLELDFGTLRTDNGPLPVATAGAAYEAPLRALGGTAPYTWSASGLPAGLLLDAASGAITGRAPYGALGRHRVAIELHSADGQTIRVTRELEVAPLVLEGSIVITSSYRLDRNDAISIMRQHSNDTAREEAQSVVRLEVAVTVPPPGGAAEFVLRSHSVDGSFSSRISGSSTRIVRQNGVDCTVGVSIVTTESVPVLTLPHTGRNTSFGRLTVTDDGRLGIDFGLAYRYVTGSGTLRVVEGPRALDQPVNAPCVGASAPTVDRSETRFNGPAYGSASVVGVPIAGLIDEGRTSGTQQFVSRSSAETLRLWGVTDEYHTMVTWTLAPR